MNTATFDNQQLNLVFKALADETRRLIVDQLTNGTKNIKALAEPFNMSFAAVSKHIKVLENAGIVKRLKQGREHLCQLDPNSLTQAKDWIAFYENFWDQRLDALANLIEE